MSLEIMRGRASSWISLVTCAIFFVTVSCAETMRVPVRDLEKLNEEQKTYFIQTKAGLGFYADGIVWSDTLVTILDLDPEYHPDSTAAEYDALPLTIPVEDIESIERMRFDEAIYVPVRDLQKLNEFGKKTYLIQTKDGLGFYADEVVWSDTLVTILGLNSKFYPDSTAALLDSLPIALPVEDIASIGRVTTDKEEAILILLLAVGCFSIVFILIPALLEKMFEGLS